MFDHSARDAEHLQNFPFVANPGFSERFRASGRLFGNSIPNTAPTDMQAALCGERSAGATIMVPTDQTSRLAVRPRQAAKAVSRLQAVIAGSMIHAIIGGLSLIVRSNDELFLCSDVMSKKYCRI